MSFSNLHLADLEYADGTILLSNDIDKFTAALSVHDRESCKLGLKVSWAKTKLMHVGEYPDPPSLNIDGNAVEFADSFVYLGSTTVTLNPISSADAHYRQMLCRHSASHCGASSLFRVPPRCAYTMQQSCLCCCTARRPGLSLEPSPPGLTVLTVGLSDRSLAFTGATSFPIKRCGPLPDNPRPPLWLLAAGSADMDMCFACHCTILLGLSWTSTLARSAGSDPEEPHAPVGSTWSNAILTSSASIQPQLNPSRRIVINGGLW